MKLYFYCKTIGLVVSIAGNGIVEPTLSQGRHCGEGGG